LGGGFELSPPRLTARDSRKFEEYLVWGLIGTRTWAALLRGNSSQLLARAGPGRESRARYSREEFEECLVRGAFHFGASNCRSELATNAERSSRRFAFFARFFASLGAFRATPSNVSARNERPNAAELVGPTFGTAANSLKSRARRDTRVDTWGVPIVVNRSL
jgi:hypothetical protein